MRGGKKGELSEGVVRKMRGEKVGNEARESWISDGR